MICDVWICVVGALFERIIVHMDSARRMTSALGMIAAGLTHCGLSRGALRGSRLALLAVSETPLRVPMVEAPWWESS